MSSYRLALFIATMCALAILTFYVTMTLAETRGWMGIGFEQAAVIGCLVSATVPLLIYARSPRLSDKILTIVQVCLLGATATASFLAPYFQQRTIVLFGVWFISASIGVTVTVRLTIRFAQKNGERLSDKEIQDLQESISRLQLLEARIAEDVYRAEAVIPVDMAEITALRETWEYVHQLRITKTALLMPHGSVHPPPVFSEHPSERDSRPNGWVQ